MNIKHRIRKIPVLGPFIANVYVRLANARFHGSGDYWERRYVQGGNSGDGSYGELATFKARVLNELVQEYNVTNVVEFGCGDGHQLTLARYPQYHGFDVSERAIQMCRQLFAKDQTKRFSLMKDYTGEVAELAMSLDVIYHLVEDDVYADYMRTLFGASNNLVVIYASNSNKQDDPQPPHVRHRRFTDWVEQYATDWRLIRKIDNTLPYDAQRGVGSPADFYIYSR